MPASASVVFYFFIVSETLSFLVPFQFGKYKEVAGGKLNEKGG